MDKKKIKHYLTKTFINESNTPGISVTDKAKKESGKINKDGLKSYSKEVQAKEDKDTKSMAKNKFNYDDKFEKTYHDEMEIMNGQEMLQYDSKPNNQFVERVKQGIEGSSTMGNEGKIGNAEATWGASSDDFGKNLVKRIKASTEKRNKQTPTLNLRGRDIQADKKDTGHRPYAIEESVNEMAAPKKQLSEKGDYNNAYHTAKSLAIKLEKKAMRDMMGENQSKVVVAADEKVTNDKKKKDFVPDEDLERAEREVEYGSSQQSDLKTENNNKTIQKESMKRLKFKTTFNGLGNALKLIPESYRVDKKEFEMTDGNESYKIRWEGNLNEGKAVVLSAADKKLVNEDINRMKQLFGYKSQETLGLVKGNARVNENKVFGDIWNKSKVLLGESEDMEGAKATEGNWGDKTKKAPEATKHVQGSTSKDKGTQAPKAKEGDLDNAVSQAPESKKHMSSGSAKATEKAKEGYWEDVTGGENMMETEASAPKEGRWEDNVKGQAAEAKKHVHLKESTLDELMEEDEFEVEVDDEETGDSWNKADDEDSSSEMEPSSSEMGGELPIDDASDDEEEEVVSVPKPTGKGGAQLLFSPSRGIYWIKGPGLPMNGMEVPEQFLSIASDNTKKNADKAAMILKKMEEIEPEDEIDSE